MQAWVAADGLAVGGVALGIACQFLGINRGTERHLTMMCNHDSAPWTVKGEGKVVGDTWCTKFTYPNGTTQDRCDELFKIGENKYEFRTRGVPVNRVYRLVP